MKTILEKINQKDLPLYLKGGTSLLLCYDLDRFSEDIDFNSNTKLNLENTIIPKDITVLLFAEMLPTKEKKSF